MLKVKIKGFKHLQEGKGSLENLVLIAKIQCYRHYSKDCPKYKKGNNKEDREEIHFKEEVEEIERGKAFEVRACDITIGKHEGQLEQNLLQPIVKVITLGNLIRN